MKKLLMLMLTILVLTGCKAAMNEKPETVLKDNQEAIVQEMNKIAGDIEEGTAKGSFSVDVESKEMNANLSSDFNVKFNKKEKKSETNLKLKVSGNENKEGGKKMGGDAEVDLIASDTKVFMKLNSLNMDDSTDPTIAMAKGMVNQYVGQWISADLTKYVPELSKIQTKDVLAMQKDIMDAIKEYPVLKVEKTNEDSDYYNYDVKLDAENTMALAEKIAIIIDKENAPTDEQRKQAIEDIKKINFVGNLKVDPSDKKYFIFAGEIESTKLMIENTKKKFIFKVEPEGNLIEVNVDKDGDNFKGTITVKEGGSDAMVLNISGKLKTNDMELNVEFNDKEKGNIKFAFNVKIDKSSVEITEPTDAKAVEELIGGFMGAMLGGANMPVEPMMDDMEDMSDDMEGMKNDMNEMSEDMKDMTDEIK